EFIEFRNNAEPPNEVYLNENSFIIQQNDSTKFNQIKGKNMVGLINGQILYRINVNGNGQSIYYPADDKEYIGINKAESSNITLYLSDNQINRITFIGSPVGTMKPLIEQVSPESHLDGFNWRIKERPTNRYDIFGNKAETEEYIALPETEIENKIASPTEANKEIEAEDQ
nr:hypothetical protein [Prolixibacteraceae bacterium]